MGVRRWGLLGPLLLAAACGPCMPIGTGAPHGPTGRLAQPISEFGYIPLLLPQGQQTFDAGWIVSDPKTQSLYSSVWNLCDSAPTSDLLRYESAPGPQESAFRYTLDRSEAVGVAVFDVKGLGEQVKKLEISFRNLRIRRVQMEELKKTVDDLRCTNALQDFAPSVSVVQSVLQGVVRMKFMDERNEKVSAGGIVSGRFSFHEADDGALESDVPLVLGYQPVAIRIPKFR